MKPLVLTLGTLSALLIVAQLVMGQLILSGGPEQALWIKRHQHSGYLTVVVTLAYVGLSMALIASSSRREKV
jgi:hypothetical protein